LPSIVTLHDELSSRGLSVLLVNLGEPRTTVASVAGQRRYTAPMLLDADGTVMEAYGVQFTPTVFIVGREGQLLGRAIGPRSWGGPTGRALLQHLVEVVQCFNTVTKIADALQLQPDFDPRAGA
jgi:hypothetical protein